MNILEQSTRHYGYIFAGGMIGAIFGIVAGLAFKPSANGYNQTIISQNISMAVPLVVSSCTLLGLGAGMALSYRRCLQAQQNRRAI